MRRRNEINVKVGIVLLLLLFIVLTSLFTDYIYNNEDEKEKIELEAMSIQRNILIDEIGEILDLKKIDLDYILGKVIVRDMHNFYKEVIINIGEQDGVLEGDAVVNKEGLVGVVSKVEKSKSYVKLLSSDYNVSVKIRNTYGNLSKGTVNLLDKYSEIEKGDLVYTSGYSDIVEGIYVGKIEDISYDKENLGKEVKIKLVNNSNLRYIAVIRGIK